jgi:hypothetical protein
MPTPKVYASKKMDGWTAVLQWKKQHPGFWVFNELINIHLVYMEVNYV